MSAPVAIVTGAGRGIGRAVAVELAQAGYQLGLVARSESELKETARLCSGGWIFPADVSDAAACKHVVEQMAAVSGAGCVDVLVNNAGSAPQLFIETITEAEWRSVLDINLSGVVYMTSAVWGQMVRRKAGVVVNISSVAAPDPFPGLGFYGAAKAAVNTLTLSLAREGQPHGIRVHAIGPGAVETAMFRNLLTPAEYPSELALSPEEVAAAVRDCIDGPMRYTSGQVIYLRKTI